MVVITPAVPELIFVEVPSSVNSVPISFVTFAIFTLNNSFLAVVLKPSDAFWITAEDVTVIVLLTYPALNAVIEASAVVSFR